MNITKLTKTTAVLLVGIALAASTASAATTAYNAGDLLIGFTKNTGTGSTNSYVLDIGQASQYRTASGSIVLNTAAISANGSGAVTGIGTAANIYTDISTALGDATWATDGTVSWGVVGAIGSTNLGASGPNRDPARTIYASNTSIAPTDPSFFRRDLTTQTSGSNNILNFANGGAGTGYSLNDNTGSLSPVGLNMTNAYTGSFYNWTYGATQTNGNFDYFPNTLLGVAANNSVLDLFRMQVYNQPVSGQAIQGVASGNGTDLGQLLGNFTLTTSGSNATITFNPGAVPEPSRALLLAGGLVSLFLRRRRPVATV